MNIKTKLITLALLATANTAIGQLPDGSIAPDFTFTDMDGNVQNLYSYLNAGKTVYIDIFAAHCPICWAYHNTHAMADLYTQHGPAGTLSQDVMVIAIEHDPGNGAPEIFGTGGFTQGNWDAGFPICNPEGAARDTFITNYAATFYPMIYGVCPNGTLKQLGTQTAAEQYAYAGQCAAVNGLTDNTFQPMDVFYNSRQAQIDLSRLDALQDITLYITDISGRPVSRHTLPAGTSMFPVRDLSPGVYVYSVTVGARLYTGKFVY